MASKTRDGTSKTARASVVRTGGRMTDADRVLEASHAEAPRIVPLGGGARCYFFDPLGPNGTRMVSLDLDTDAFVEAVRPACELGMADRLRLELKALAERYPMGKFDATLTRLGAAGLL